MQSINLLYLFIFINKFFLFILYITLENLQGVFIGAFTHILVLPLGIFV